MSTSVLCANRTFPQVHEARGPRRRARRGEQDQAVRRDLREADGPRRGPPGEDLYSISGMRIDHVICSHFALPFFSFSLPFAPDEDVPRAVQQFVHWANAEAIATVLLARNEYLLTKNHR